MQSGATTALAHERRWRRALPLALLLLVGAASPTAAQVLQVDALLSLPTGAGGAAGFAEPIESGPARVTGIARNLRGDAVQLDLTFRYRLPRDTIALDEVIERIEITTETPEGEVFFATTIDTQLIPLNPNRTPLFYRATLYHPDAESGERYVVRVRVFGNYE
jgi:hypothetical protein